MATMKIEFNPFILYALICLFFCVKMLYQNYHGNWYIHDEYILQHLSHSSEAKSIELSRRNRTYRVYIPIRYREDYFKRYGYCPWPITSKNGGA